MFEGSEEVKGKKKKMKKKRVVGPVRSKKH